MDSRGTAGIPTTAFVCSMPSKCKACSFVTKIKPNGRSSEIGYYERPVKDMLGSTTLPHVAAWLNSNWQHKGLVFRKSRIIEVSQEGDLGKLSFNQNGDPIRKQILKITNRKYDNEGTYHKIGTTRYTWDQILRIAKEFEQQV